MWFLVAKIFQGELGTYIARLKRLATIYVVMAVFAILLLAFLITALFIYVAAHIGALNAALIASAICFAILIVLWITAIVVRRKPDKRVQDRLNRDIASIAGTAALANLPKVFAAARKRKAIAFLTPVAGILAYGVYRAIGSRDN